MARPLSGRIPADQNPRLPGAPPRSTTHRSLVQDIPIRQRASTQLQVTSYDYLDFEELASFMERYIPFEREQIKLIFEKFDEDASPCLGLLASCALFVVVVSSFVAFSSAVLATRDRVYILIALWRTLKVSTGRERELWARAKSQVVARQVLRLTVADLQSLRGVLRAFLFGLMLQPLVFFPCAQLCAAVLVRVSTAPPHLAVATFARERRDQLIPRC